VKRLDNKKSLERWEVVVARNFDAGEGIWRSQRGGERKRGTRGRKGEIRRKRGGEKGAIRREYKGLTCCIYSR